MPASHEADVMTEPTSPLLINPQHLSTLLGAVRGRFAVDSLAECGSTSTLLLERAAQEPSRLLSRRGEAFTSLLGPPVVLLMGGVVLFIVLAILLPVFEINQFVK